MNLPIAQLVDRRLTMITKPELPLEMGGIEPGDEPVNFRIGVCKACGRRGLIGRYSGKCEGYRAVTAANGIVQVPELRSVRCGLLAARNNPSDRKLLGSYRRPEYVPYTEVGRQ
jgi:hypothetical protein